MQHDLLSVLVAKRVSPGQPCDLPAAAAGIWPPYHRDAAAWFSPELLPGEQSLRGHTLRHVDHRCNVSGGRALGAAAIPGRLRLPGPVRDWRLRLDAQPRHAAWRPA